IAHLLVFDVTQRLRRGDGDRVTRVHTHRIEVLYRTHDHAVVDTVAHDLEFELFPTGDRTLDEDLADWAGVKAFCREAKQFVLVGGDAGAFAAEDERRTHDDGEPDRPTDADNLVEAVRKA